MVVKDRALIVKDRSVMHILFYPVVQHSQQAAHQQRGGSQPVPIGGGESRTFLEDGDSVILRGWCERPGAVRIGFGEAHGRILPALDLDLPQ